MEISSKNSSDQYLFQIQRQKETPKRTDSSFAENRNENITRNARYLAYRDFPSVSRCNRENARHDRGTEMILLKSREAAAGYRSKLNPASRWVIDLGDSDSKLALRRHLGEMAECGNSNSQSTASAEYSDMEILQKLPSDTVVIKQETKVNSENCDYEESAEMNSGGSSSGCATARVKRISRSIRNKSEAIEVRRNPMRVSKKNFTKDFSQSKHQLLSAKRDVCSNYESSKRMKVSPIPYMNTRSVTRKMYTVGATYQAPTKRDETEWKEWPVHGMHERPVYHPQAGLAVEYLGRYFTSLDGLSYCEIIDQPEIEIVAVDPHVGDQQQRSVSSAERTKPREKTKKACVNKRPSISSADSWNAFLSPNNRSFETCMHGSLHYVLGYCSQIMSPTYKRAIEEKMMHLTSPAKSFPEAEQPSGNKEIAAANSSEKNVNKIAEDANLLKGAYAVAVAHSVRSKSNAIDRRANLPSSSIVYAPEAQNSSSLMEIDSSKIAQASSGEIASRMSLQQILQDSSSNSSLILLRNSSAKANEQVRATTAAASDPTVQLENAAIGGNDTMLAEMSSSSIYSRSRACPSERGCGCINESSTWNSLYNLKRQATENAPNYPTKKTVLLEKEGKKSQQAASKSHENKSSVDEAAATKINNADSSGRLSSAVASTSFDKGRTWSTNRTSEIARILSEYNKTISARKSAMRSQIYGSRSGGVKPSSAVVASGSSGAANPPRSGLWMRKDAAEKTSRSLVTDASGEHFNFSQGKWKRFYLTRDDQIKDAANANRNASWHAGYSTSLENYPDSLRSHQGANLSANLNYVKEKPVEIHNNDSNKREVAATDAKPKEAKSGYPVDKTSSVTTKTRSMQELLENTAILYCAANGIHQDDLSNYIDTLDARQSTKWLEEWKNSVV